MEKIDGNIYWIDGNGDVVGFDSMPEHYVLILMEYFAKKRWSAPTGLLSRAEYFQEKRNNIKELF